MMQKKLGPEALLQKLKELRKSLPPIAEQLDAEAILQAVAEMRESLPEITGGQRSNDTHDGRSLFPEGEPAETEEDFEWAAVIDALESFADDVSAIAEHKEAKLIESLLELYYAAEEAARDPANAELLPHLQEMREAYEHDFGEPIPPRKPRKE
jgi:hypothetical protein